MNAAEKFLEEFGNIDDEFIEEAMSFTMKKRFNFKPIIAVAACAAIALAAVPIAKRFINIEAGNAGGTTATQQVATGENFKVFYGGGSGVTDGNPIYVYYPIEYEFDGRSENFIDAVKRGTEKTVEIAGKKYTGVYTNTTISDYYKEDADNYFGEDGDIMFDFSINRETGVCVNFYIADNEPITETKWTRDECYAKAIEHLKTYVDDIENYELCEEYHRGGNLGYLFRLYRMIDGMKTFDCIDIRVRENGEVYNHSLYSIGQMKNVTLEKMKINISDINKAVSDKIKAIYEKYNFVDYSIKGVMISRNAEGKYILVYDCLVDIANANTAEIYTNRTKIIVEIN